MSVGYQGRGELPHSRVVGKRAKVIPAFVLLSALAALSGCSHKHTLNRDEVRSQIRLATSLAAETEMYVDYVRQGRVTRLFAREHAIRLQDTAKELMEELERAEPGPGAGTAVHECRMQLALICRELSNIRAAIGNDEALAAAKERIAKIHRSLERASSSL
jgi:hypothetical protein